MQWPTDPPLALNNARNSYPELAALGRRRDRASDAARLYAAMAVEGFVNFYGVLRLGQLVFDEHFERLGMVPKLQRLLLICESLNVTKAHGIVAALERVAASRNSLVHPKAREIPRAHGATARTSIPLPEHAQASIDSMEEFFTRFVELVPGMARYLEHSVEDV